MLKKELTFLYFLKYSYKKITIKWQRVNDRRQTLERVHSDLKQMKSFVSVAKYTFFERSRSVSSNAKLHLPVVWSN